MFTGWLSSWIAPAVTTLGLVLSALAFIAEELGDKHSKHRWRLFWIVVIFGVLTGVFSIVSTEVQRREAASEKFELQGQNRKLQANIDAIRTQNEQARKENSKLLQEIRDLEQKPVLNPPPEPPLKAVSTWVEPGLTVGQPRSVRVTLQNTTGGIVPVTIRRIQAYAPLKDGFSDYTEEERGFVEDQAYKDLLKTSFGPLQNLATANGGELELSNSSPPLSADQVDALKSGKALMYFLAQINNQATGATLYEMCAFISPAGELLNCREHNKP